MWIIFKVFTEFVTILLPFCVWFFGPGHMWDLRPPTRDQTHTPGVGRQSLNHWATGKSPRVHFKVWQKQYNIVKLKNKIKFKK